MGEGAGGGELLIFWGRIYETGNHCRGYVEG